MERQGITLLHGTKDDSTQHEMIDVNQIRMHPTSANLLPVATAMLGTMTRSMNLHCHCKSQAVTLAVCSEQPEPFLAGGNLRLQAALAVGMADVPFVMARFDSETESVQHVIVFETERRVTTDGALYGQSDQLAPLMELDRALKNGETGKSTTHVVNFAGPSASAKKTSQLIDSNCQKVDRIRRIRRDGWPEIQEAVRNDEIKINKAYKLIRDMELGSDESENKLAAAHIKAAKTLLSEENFAV